MLSAFCRCLSSCSTTSWSPETGAQALPEAVPPEELPPPEPDEPDCPQAATRAAARRSGGMILLRERMLRPPSVSRAARRPRRVSGGRSPAEPIEPLGCARGNRLADLLRARYLGFRADQSGTPTVIASPGVAVRSRC